MMDEEIIKRNNFEQTQKTKKVNIWSLCKYPSLRYKFIFLNILLIGTKAAFNGVSISSKSFKGNFNVNIIVLFIIESFSYFITGFLIDIKKLGRKGTLWILYALVIIVFVLLSFLKLNTAGSLALNFIARFCCAGIDVIYYTYTIELYPNSIKSLAFCINTGFGNFGSIISPYLLEFLKNWQCLIVFAAMFALNAIIIIFFPETVGKSTFENIKELEMENDIKNQKEYDKKSEIEAKIINIFDFNGNNSEEKESNKENGINIINGPNNDANGEVKIYNERNQEGN